MAGTRGLITRSVQEAWAAMDNGQSFEEATTLPPPKCIHFPWLDSFRIL